MNLRELVDRFCGEISGDYRAGSYCDFAPADETLGFLDTSADKSSGIVFLCDRLRVKSGEVKQAYYSDIMSVEVIPSGEDDYADELCIRTRRSELRISDYALNKRVLKALIDELCVKYASMTEEAIELECAQTSAGAMEHFSAEQAECPEAMPEQAQAYVEFIPQPDENSRQEAAENVEPQADISSVAEAAEEPAQASAEIDFIPLKAPSEQSIPAETAVPEVSVEALIEERRSSALDSTAPSVDEILDELESKNSPEPSPVMADFDEDFEPEENLEDMTHEETLSYLLSSISEINSAPSDNEDIDFDNIPPDPAVVAYEAPPQPDEAPADTAVGVPPINGEAPITEETDTAEITEISEPAVSTEAGYEEAPPASLFTHEPRSDDIYIKASSKLREFCEIGKLSREQIKASLKENLMEAANAFAEITADGENIPEGLAPRIAELRAASDSLPAYFALGEDIAERVMFFMMYQMLSYSDRIAETPETKERLNDFFRRYGPAGITLSMLDMRIQ